MRLASRTAFAASAVLLLAGCGGERPASSPPAANAPPPGTPIATPATSDPRATIFVEKGCPQCHTISALGIKSPAELGPDLTFAYTDVQSRFNMKLDEFLKNPTGTMQVVLSSQIKLTAAELDSVIHILKELHEEAEEAAETTKDD